MKTLKYEEVDARPYRTLEELNDHVAEFIDQIYNLKRLHSALATAHPSSLRSSMNRTTPGCPRR
jgi:hypothetical protein